MLSDLPCRRAVKVILQVALRMRRGFKKYVPRSILWPLPLFMAGIETSDPVYRDWISSALKKDEPCVSNMHKTITLLESVQSRQDKLGHRVDIGEIMNETTKFFVI